MTRLRVVVIRLAALFALIAAAAPTSGLAQTIPFSQRGFTGQTVGFTDITVHYGRPVARGRKLFGDSALIPSGAIWHPGADSATRISVNRDVLVEGHPLKAGEYTVWLVPRTGVPWTVIISRAAHVFHTPYPGEQHDVLRFDVATERGASMETLAIYFPVVVRDDAVMRIHWGEMIVPIRIKAPYRPE